MKSRRLQQWMLPLVAGLVLAWTPAGAQWLAHGAPDPGGQVAHCVQDQAPCQDSRCERCCTACVQCAQAVVAGAAGMHSPAAGKRAPAAGATPGEPPLEFFLRPPRAGRA